MSNETGSLYVVATPIGNLGDISARALEVLGRVDGVLAEDTRVTRRLLAAHGIATPLTAVHEHNEARRVAGLLERLRAGESLALVSDAGTPLLSDPGYRLVRAAREAGLPVLAVAGPSSITAALSVSGLPVDAFVFEGFLPPRAGRRRRVLERLAHEPRTLVLFEAPHRLVDTLEDMERVLGSEREVCVLRELTKRFESAYFGPLGEVVARIRRDPAARRGELVLVVRGAGEPAAGAAALRPDRVLTVLARELPPARAAAVAAELTGRPRGELYRLLVAAGGDGGDDGGGA